MKVMENAVVLHERRHMGDANACERAQLERDVCVAAREWRCPFIVELVAAFQTSEKLYYIFEYCPGGELYTALGKQSGGRFPEATTKLFVAEICLALEHLHAHNTVHRDVRLENILLDADGHVKLADFGLAKRLSGDGIRLPRAIWRSSTLRSFPLGRPSARIWTVGSSVRPPLPCSPADFRWPARVGQECCRPGPPRASPPRSGTDQAGSSFCENLLAHERTRRLGYPNGASQLRRHAFFKGLDWDAVAAKSMGPPLPPSWASCPSPKSNCAFRNTLGKTGLMDLFRLPRFSFRVSAFRASVFGRTASQ